MSDKVPFSVVIITQNEERNIGDALESVRDFDDIVVVDAFSSDRTVEICKNYTERVYQHEWPGFSLQKQRAVDYAKHAWVLVLDADERVTPVLIAEMIKEIAGNGYSGFYVPRKNYFLGSWIRHSAWWPDYTLRLFRKETARFEPREVHEKVIVSGSTKQLMSPLLHYTYRTLSDYTNKMETYTTLAAREIVRQKGLPSPLTLVVNPMAVFVKMYFLRQGFRDGINGFMLAVLYAFQTFLKYAKAIRNDPGHISDL
jgi:glycosyltransferase involved in cell wall biosynthesis